MKNKATTKIFCWYASGNTGHTGFGILAVQFSTGFTNLNDFSRRFSNKKEELSIRFAAMNAGFSVSGSEGNAPLTEEALREIAADFIRTVRDIPGSITWESKDFLTQQVRTKRRERPLFGLVRRDIPPQCIPHSEVVSHATAGLIVT